MGEYIKFVFSVNDITVMYLLIAWLITLQCKIPVTAGPINPKLPTNLKSARLGMKSARLYGFMGKFWENRPSDPF